FLVRLDERGDAVTPGKFLTAADLGEQGTEAAFKTVLIDGATGEPVVPNGSLGFRFAPDGEGRWNLDLGGVDPLLTLYGTACAAACPPAGSPATSSPPCSTSCSPSTAWPGPACPASGRRATTTRPCRTPRPGRSGSPRCPRSGRRASPASSPATPSDPAAGR